MNGWLYMSECLRLEADNRENSVGIFVICMYESFWKRVSVLVVKFDGDGYRSKGYMIECKCN